MFEDELHGRIVGKAAILLVEAKVREVEMDNQRRWLIPVFLQDICLGFRFAPLNQYQYELAGQTAIPYGSVILLTVLPPPSIPAFPLRVRSCGSPGFWESLRLLPKREPSPFSSPFTPFVGFTDGCLNPDGGLLELADGDREG